MNFLYAIAAGTLLACGQYFMKRLSGSVALDLASLKTAVQSPFTYCFLAANFASSVLYVLALRGESLLFVFSLVYVTMALTAGAIDYFIIGNILTPQRMLGFALALVSMALLVKS